jgi:leucyl aminopeptidase
MHVTATTDAPPATGADTIVVGVFEDEGIAHDHGGVLQALVDSGEARRGLRKLAVTHAEGRRYIVAGLGGRADFDPERARVAAATVAGRAQELGTRTLCWEVPHHVSDTQAGALVEGTLLAAYTYSEFKSGGDDDPGLAALILSAHHDVSAPAAFAATVAEAVNAARDLQNRPANALTPAALAERAQALDGVAVDVLDGAAIEAAGMGAFAAVAQAVNAARDLQNRPANALTPTALAERSQALEGVSVEVLDGAGIEAAGMGAFACVAQGSYEDARLITVRYEPQDVTGPLLGFVGKAVTFDSGGISIKPAAKMHEMKFDMSGGAAVIEAVGAIARLGLPVRVAAVVGATENMPSGRAVKPGDIVRAKSGVTIEVNNTDAEGRLVLADCLAHAIDLGAERLIDLATLTGAITVALGRTYAGLFSNDDAWAAEVTAAGERTGERVWRLPLHAEYAKAIEGRYADIVNSPA